MTTPILTAARSLPSAELNTLVEDLLQVRAERSAPSVSAVEGPLLARINAGLPADVWAEYRRLRRLRDAGELTADDHAELKRLGERDEESQADRVAALAELAAVRGQTLLALASELGFGPAVE